MKPAELRKQVNHTLRRLDWTVPRPELWKAAEAVRALGGGVLPLLLEGLGGTLQRKQKSAEGFWAMGTSAESAIPELEKRLESESHYVAFALVGIGPAALPLLLRALSHPQPPVRSGTASGIAHIAGCLPLDGEFAEQLIPPLIERVSDRYDFVRRDAVSAIGKVRRCPDLCVPLLLNSLQRGSPHVQHASMFALSGFGEHARAAIPLLRSAARSEDKDSRFFAVRALAWGWPSDPKVVPCLVESLADPDPSVRGEAALAIGAKCQFPDIAVPALIEFIQRPENIPLGWQPVSALQSWGSLAKNAVPLLLHALEKNGSTHLDECLRVALRAIDPEIDLQNGPVPPAPPALIKAGRLKELYGKAKANRDLRLKDLLRYPIWRWCMDLPFPDEADGPEGGDETGMRPMRKSTDVTPEMSSPLILLRVKGTELYADGLYEGEKRRLVAIHVYQNGKPAVPRFVPGLPDPLILVAVPTIEGVAQVEFQVESGDPGAEGVRL